MKTFGTLISEARRTKGLSQKDLASKVKKEDGQAISAQYFNDIEHDRRNPPSEFLIAQIAERLPIYRRMFLSCSGDNTHRPAKMATTQPAED